MDRDIETQRIMDLAAMMANHTSPSREEQDARRIEEAHRLIEAAAEVLTGETWEEWLEDITRSLVAHGVPRDVAENHVQTEFGGVVEHRPTLAAA
jgi:hypothetical protein